MTSIPAIRLNGQMNQAQRPEGTRVLSLPAGSWHSRIAKFASAPPTLPQSHRGLSLVQTHQCLSSAAPHPIHAAPLTVLRDRVAALAAAMLLLLAAN
jgi:hypothetical protein